MNTTTTRWDRLAATLADAGIPAEVERNVWCGEIVCRITIQVDGGLVSIRDTSWHDHWTGWQVTADDPEGIVARWFPKTKKRAEVVQHVQDARAVLAKETADGH